MRQCQTDVTLNVYIYINNNISITGNTELQTKTFLLLMSVTAVYCGMEIDSYHVHLLIQGIEFHHISVIKKNIGINNNNNNKKIERKSGSVVCANSDCDFN